MSRPFAKNWGLKAVIFGAACAYQIFDLATAIEARPPVLLWLEYLAIGGMFLGFVNALFQLTKGNP
jgi:hypothetical protein